MRDGNQQRGGAKTQSYQKMKKEGSSAGRDNFPLFFFQLPACGAVC